MSAIQLGRYRQLLDSDTELSMTETLALGFLAMICKDHDGTDEVTMPQDSIAKKCRMSARTMIRALQTLEAKKLIVRSASKRADGTRGTDTIRVTIPALTEIQGRPVRESHTALSESHSKRDNLNTNNTIEQPALLEADAPAPENFQADFDAWWKEYPKKVDKKPASDRYKAIRKQKRATAEELMTAVLAYKELRKGEDPHYTISPFRWLKNERWTDEALKPEPEKSRYTSVRDMPGFDEYLAEQQAKRSGDYFA